MDVRRLHSTFSQLREELPALSCGEWDGKTLAELGLCETEHPRVTATHDAAHLPAVKSALLGYGYELRAEEITQPCTAYCSVSLTALSCTCTFPQKYMFFKE